MRKTNKAFTLIELLAVIIILAIVALIATPIVLDVVDDARTSAAKSEAAMIVSGINNYCATAEMKAQMNNTTSECEEVTKEDVTKMVDLGNAKVLELTYDKKVTYLKVESNTKIVIYDGSKYTIDGEVVETKPTYEYLVGDDVTLIDGTTWVVIKDSLTSENEIKLISTLNVKNNLTTETGTSMFTSTPKEYALAYDNSGNNSNLWEDSTLKQYLDSTVKEILEDSLTTTISDITIFGVEELTALGCTVTGNEAVGYDNPVCDETKLYYSKVFVGLDLWTKLPSVLSDSYVVYIDSNDDAFATQVNISTRIGARPIITVSKDVIKK